jgi:hypothetical protein
MWGKLKKVKYWQIQNREQLVDYYHDGAVFSVVSGYPKGQSSTTTLE